MNEYEKIRFRIDVLKGISRVRPEYEEEIGNIRVRRLGNVTDEHIEKLCEEQYG